MPRVTQKGQVTIPRQNRAPFRQNPISSQRLRYADTKIQKSGAAGSSR